MGYFISTSVEPQKVSPQKGSHYTLKELQAYVEGYIEIVYVEDNVIMVVNEEGMLRDMHFNPIASKIARQPIFGNALLCLSSEIK